MKKFVIIILLLLFILPANSETTITGGIEYTTNTVREELLNNPVINIPRSLVQSNLIDLKADIKDRSVGKFSDGSYAVIYKNNPKYVWYYGENGILTHAEVKDGENYPYKTYKYTPDNKLVNMSLRVSKEETFIFSPSGKLIAHWLRQNCYDENNQIIMTRKIYE